VSIDEEARRAEATKNTQRPMPLFAHIFGTEIIKNGGEEKVGVRAVRRDECYVNQPTGEHK
jgi:hypothetical protein